MDGLAGQAKIGGVGRCLYQTFRLGTFACGGNFTPLLRSVVFVTYAIQVVPSKYFDVRVREISAPLAVSAATGVTEAYSRQQARQQVLAGA